MVKPGYKQTEIGVIPENWEVGAIGSVCTSVAVGGNYQNSATPSDYPLIKMGNLSRGNITLEKVEYIKATIPDQKDLLHYGDVLFNTRNTPELVGKVAIWRNELPRAYYNSNLLRFVFDTEKADPFYMNLALNTEKTVSAFRNIAKGTTSVAAIYPQDLLKVIIPIPPLAEQQRIAEALSDMDELIASLEKLIAKKKAIKQGAMQELLTGKRRLPGFSGEWPSKKLKDCTERIIVGLATSVTQYYREEGIPIFRNLNILPNRLDESDVLYLDPSFAKLYSNKQVKEDDVLTVHTGYVGTSCLVPKNHAGSLTFTTLITTVKKDLLSPQYLAFHLNSDSGTKMIEALQAGGGRNNLNVSDFEQYELTFPQDMDEQVAIANILEDLDKEIGCIEQKHKKSIEIKQGMVQQLLTGKIRLV